MKRISSPEIQPFEIEHTRIVREVAAECMVLLKKDGRFPIAPCRLAAYGNGVRHTIKGGTGSGDVNVRSFSTVEQGLQAAGFDLCTGAWLDGFDAVRAKAQAAFNVEVQQAMAQGGPLAAMGMTMLEPDYDLPLDFGADAAVYVLARNSGEGADRRPIAGDVCLTASEIRDINALSAAYETFMLVLNVGGMVDLTPVAGVQNILVMSQPGMAAGDALADVLCGKAYPSGHLTMTWAPIASYPSTEGFGAQDDTEYREGIFVGYRWFDSFGAACTYPFGHGLSYTEFALDITAFAADAQAVSVAVQVTNTGKHPGREVVQLYYSAPDGKLPKPAKELAAFAKTGELKPGEKQTLTLSFPTAQMSSYDADRSAYVMEPGVYELLIGVSSAEVAPCGKLRLTREVITQQLRSIGGKPGFEDLRPAPKPAVSPDGAVVPDPDRIPVFRAEYAGEPQELTGPRGTWADVAEGRMTLEAFAGGMTDEELAQLCIGNYRDIKEGQSLLEVIGNAASHMAGAAGETTNRLPHLGLPILLMPDGPAGLRLSRKYVLRGEAAVGLDSFLGMGAEQQAGDGETVYYQYCTAIPIGTALAQTWDPEAVRRCGDLVGEEMECFGAHLWLAPALNIFRSPLCGRNFEYYSEDPLLSGLTAAAMTEGVQRHPGCATTIKHYCCNNQETNRMRNNSVLSERALREIYLKGFEICVRKAQPHCVMSSYNLVNGEHSNNRRCLLTWALRDEWGFEGFVMTDWLTTAPIDPTPHKYGTASAAGCIYAGNDMIMPGLPTDLADILAALGDASHPYPLTRAFLQQDALHILRVMQRLS